jgi:hypothetical protein
MGVAHGRGTADDMRSANHLPVLPSRMVAKASPGLLPVVKSGAFRFRVIGWTVQPIGLVGIDRRADGAQVNIRDIAFDAVIVPNFGDFGSRPDDFAAAIRVGDVKHCDAGLIWRRRMCDMCGRHRDFFSLMFSSLPGPATTTVTLVRGLEGWPSSVNRLDAGRRAPGAISMRA